MLVSREMEVTVKIRQWKPALLATVNEIRLDPVCGVFGKLRFSIALVGLSTLLGGIDGGAWLQLLAAMGQLLGVSHGTWIILRFSGVPLAKQTYTDLRDLLGKQSGGQL